MARIEWVEFRLQNWARWKAGAGDSPLGYATTSLTESVRSGYRESPVPTNAVEAAETDTAVRALHPAELGRTLVCYYCDGGTYRDKVRALGCSVATMYSRIDQAHQQLARALTERGQAAQRERARVERLQALSRPP